jgi:hypothetical protein
VIRIRVSTLEMFRRVVQTEYQPESELADRIVRGQWTDDPDVPWYMHAGTAWHRALADEAADEIVEDNSQEVLLRYGDYLFAPEAVHEGIATFGPGLREVTGWRTWDVGRQRVQVEGTADHLYGLLCQDAKTKFSDTDPADYEQSLQWRAYCLIHHARAFRYVMFSFKDPDKAGFLKLKDTYWFSMWAYPDMERDVLGWIDRFVGWAKGRGLVRYLENDRRMAS